MSEMDSSRTPVLWGAWQPSTGSYKITDGDRSNLMSPARVLYLREIGASVTCYGGPLDHRRPTAERGAYDAEIAAMRGP